MSKKNLLIASLSLCLLTYVAGTAAAKTAYVTPWKNAYPGACTTLKNAASACVLCHTDVPDLNAYGSLLQDNNRNYLGAGSADSDGDGRSNTQEITQDCTLPGDVASPNDDWKWGTLKATYR
ncbi:MAG: hypothetical protein IPG61_12490 [bacterium]|nr:hypothetical protein [bacterium]